MASPSPLLKQSLADGLAQKIKQMIDANYEAGDRLPTIADMAKQFGVGHPTLREGLRKLETVGIVRIKHGSGVYVGEHSNSLFLSNPIVTDAPTKKILLDLIDTRMPIEVRAISKAVDNATEAHLANMNELLDKAAEFLEDDGRLSATNMSFHQEIAAASGNAVMKQMLEVISSVFQQEQQVILNIYGSRKKDHAEHRAILEALKERDKELAVQRMRSHLEGVRQVIEKWDPEQEDVSHIS